MLAVYVLSTHRNLAHSRQRPSLRTRANFTHNRETENGRVVINTVSSLGVAASSSRRRYFGIIATSEFRTFVRHTSFEKHSRTIEDTSRALSRTTLIHRNVFFFKMAVTELPKVCALFDYRDVIGIRANFALRAASHRRGYEAAYANRRAPYMMLLRNGSSRREYPLI